MPTTIETLTLPNFLDNNILEELELSADAAAAQAVINVLNANNVTDNDYLVINPAEENSEMRKINTSGVVAQAITFTAALALLHRNHERVIKLFGNKIQVYRAPNIDGTPPATSAFTTLGSPVTIDPDQPYSYYTDNVGGSAYWYRFTYLNDVTSAETELDLAESIRGGGYGHYVTLADVRAEAGLPDSRRLADTQVAQRRSEAESEVKGRLTAGGYTMPLQTSTGASFVPAVVVGIARLLAAGLILQQNFGITKPGSAKDGNNKLVQARADLLAIQQNKLVLVDSNEQMLSKGDLVNGWPDDTTKDDGFTVGPVMTMSKKF